jgi:hypothetical protein
VVIIAPVIRYAHVVHVLAPVGRYAGSCPSGPAEGSHWTAIRSDRPSRPAEGPSPRTPGQPTARHGGNAGAMEVNHAS